MEQKEGTTDRTVTEVLRNALVRNDARQCLPIIPRTSHPDVPALIALMQPPTGLRHGWKRHGKMWREVRAAAARRLGELGDPKALPALTKALLYHDPILRGHALNALRAFDAVSVPTLLVALKSSHEWSLDGMNTLLYELGEQGDRRASRALTEVLFDNSPPIPSRWPALMIKPPLALIGMLWLFLGVVAAYNENEYLVIGLIVWTTMSVFLYILLVLFMTLPVGLRSSYERGVLANTAAEALGKLRDKRALPRLVDAIHYPPLWVRFEYKRTLAAMLPLLGSEDRELFNSDQMHFLTRALLHSDANLTLALVRAMEHIGGENAIRPLKRLARYPSSAKNAIPGLGDEAERVLAIVEERLRQQQNPMSLLRASVAPAAAPDQLLRPVLTETQTPADQLLRPTQSE